MYKYSKFLIVIFATFNFLQVIAGTDFFALYLPQDLKKELQNIQQYVKNRLPKDLTLSITPQDNLHITLKEIGDLSGNEPQNIQNAFIKLAITYKPFPITNAIKGAKIKFSSDGLLKLVLAENMSLTKLAKDIESKLLNAKNDGLIRSVKQRMDFPKNGHITLGQLMMNKKPLKDISKHKKSLLDIENKFKNNITSNFIVEDFTLLKSNAPSQPRIYDLKDFFSFSK